MPKSDLRLEMPMTISHFQLIWRHFATTPQLRAAILDGTDLSIEAVEGAASEIAVRQQIRQIENMDRLFAPGWIFEVTELLHFSAYGPVGVATQSAPTLGDAIGILCRYTQIRTPMTRVSLRRGRSRSKIEISCIAAVAAPAWHVVASTAIMGLRSLISSLTIQPMSALRYGLVGARTAQADRLEIALGVPVSCDEPHSYISIPTSWLAIRSPFADSALHASALANLEAMVKARTGGSFASTRLHNRVAQILAQAPPGRLDAENCAHMLGVSRRTMTRRLADEGSGFRLLLEAELQRRVQRLLATNTLSMADIAEQLGYQDVTSLRRAMVRWERAAS